MIRINNNVAVVTIPVSCGKVRNTENKLTLISSLLFRSTIHYCFMLKMTEETPTNSVPLKGQQTVPYSNSLKYNSGSTYMTCVLVSSH